MALKQTDMEMVLGMLFLEGLGATSYFWPETWLLLALFPVVVFPKTTETDIRLILEQTALDHLWWESQ